MFGVTPDRCINAVPLPRLLGNEGPEAAERVAARTRSLPATSGHLCLYVGATFPAAAPALNAANLWIHTSFDFDRNLSVFNADLSGKPTSGLVLCNGGLITAPDGHGGGCPIQRIRPSAVAHSHAGTSSTPLTIQMSGYPGRTAVIVGASSGIGEALARELDREGWSLGLLARRLDRLEALRESLAPETVVRRIDVAQRDAATILDHLFDELGGVDLVIISAGAGHLNHDLNPELDVDTVTVNVLGFMATAHVAMRYFLRRGRGHLVGISSMAALRGNRAAAAYAASKAFQSVYLDGLRDLARHSGFPIAVTEVQPGFVDTAMMKTGRPLPALARLLLVSSPATAAQQILRAVQKRAKHAYITRRYAIVAFVLKLLPRAG